MTRKLHGAVDRAIASESASVIANDVTVGEPGVDLRIARKTENGPDRGNDQENGIDHANVTDRVKETENVRGNAEKSKIELRTKRNIKTVRYLTVRMIRRKI
jgi:hypothetical protein